MPSHIEAEQKKLKKQVKKEKSAKTKHNSSHGSRHGDLAKRMTEKESLL